MIYAHMFFVFFISTQPFSIQTHYIVLIGTSENFLKLLADFPKFFFFFLIIIATTIIIIIEIKIMMRNKRILNNNINIFFLLSHVQ